MASGRVPNTHNVFTTKNSNLTYVSIKSEYRVGNLCTKYSKPITSPSTSSLVHSTNTGMQWDTLPSGNAVLKNTKKPAAFATHRLQGAYTVSRAASLWSEKLLECSPSVSIKNKKRTKIFLALHTKTHFCCRIRTHWPRATPANMPRITAKKQVRTIKSTFFGLTGVTGCSTAPS